MMASPSSAVTDIPNKSTHDTLIADSATTPTALYIFNSALPYCRELTPRYEALAQKYSSKSDGSETSVRFAQMDHTPETSPMFKFAPTQLPVVVLIREGVWAKTLMSPTIKEVEKGVEELLEKAGRLRN